MVLDGRFFTRLKKLPGTAPGTLVHTGEPPEKTRITVIDYDSDNLEEKEISSIEECFSYSKTKSTTWINIDGYTPEIIQTLGEHFGLHMLLLEDILDVNQRPKFEEYPNTVFLVAKMLRHEKGVLDDEQVSIVFGKNFVITFQEREGDVFDPVRERLRKGKGRRIRDLGADYLAYALIDVIVDTYFLTIEAVGDELDKVEHDLLEGSEEGDFQEIMRMRRELLFLRKHVWPLREVLSQLYRSDAKLIGKETRLFLRDVYDHCVQVVDTIETFRDMASSLYDTYLSSVNNKMSEVMKVLTIIATIFIPLTFVAGVYGMNFEHMPELATRNGYYVVLAIMAAIAIVMIAYFKKKNWL